MTVKSQVLVALSPTARRWIQSLKISSDERDGPALARYIEEIASQWQAEKFVPYYDDSWRQVTLRGHGSNCNRCDRAFIPPTDVLENVYHKSADQTVRHYFHPWCLPRTGEPYVR